MQLTSSLTLLIALAEAHTAFGVGINVPHPNVTFSHYPPGSNRTVPEPEHRLLPGRRYANPNTNPFKKPGAFGYGPPTVVQLKNVTEPGTVNISAVCQTGGTGASARYVKHQGELLHRNGTLQVVGFSRDILDTLEQRRINESLVGEVTRGRRVVYNGTAESKREAEGRLEKKFILGPDGRVEDTNTWLYPWNTVGHVGPIGHCTGTLISPRHVLTAGHCVNSGGPNGDWFDNLDFTITRFPGENGQPFTDITYIWEQVWSVQGWTQNGDWDYDYALIQLYDFDGSNLPYMDFGWDDGMSKSWYVNTDGYPEDKDAHTMWHSFDFISEVDDLVIRVNLDVVHGDSGSPVYLYLEDPTSLVLYAVISNQFQESYPNVPDFWNSHTLDFNGALRITQDRFNQICGWMDAGIC